jgi:hypothetical protein
MIHDRTCAWQTNRARCTCGLHGGKPEPTVTPAMIGAFRDSLDDGYLGDGRYMMDDEAICAALKAAILASP